MSEDRSAAATERELVIARVFDAPRELVWKAWTESEHIAAWWGPEGFSTRVEENDFRAGGKTRYVMVGPDGTEYPVGGVIKEIVPQERIVTTDEFEEGYEYKDIAEADLPQGVIMTVLFEDLGQQTKLTLHIAHPTPEERRKHEEMGVVGGWQSSFDCLDEYLREMAA